MTIPFPTFDDACDDAARTYSAIFHSPPCAAGSACCQRSPGGTGLVYAAVRTDRCWHGLTGAPASKRLVGARVAVTMSDPAEGQRVFDALAEGGAVERPYEATDWSPGFGCVTDRWGTRWMVDALAAPRGGA